MEILNYTEDHKAFRERLRSFLAREVVPHVDQWEKDKIVPKEAWRRMGQEGFLCPTISKEYGGMGGDFLYSVIVNEEVIRSNSSGLFAPLHSDIVVPYIDSYAREEQKRKYLPGCVSGDIISAVAMTEPGAGSDLAALGTTAVDTGDEVIINGSKTFISNGINSELVVLAARDPLVDDPHQAISLYLIEADTPGFERGRHLEKMGIHSQDTAELFFNNCRIPKENLLGEKGRGFIMLMEKLQQERLVCAIMAVVAAENMVEWTVAYCKETQRAGKPLSRYQPIQFALVEMTTEVNLGRTFTDNIILEHVKGNQVVIETSMAKYWTTDMARRVAERSLDLLGDYGVQEDCPVVRGWRDVKIMSIFAGTNEVMKTICARFMGL